MGLGRVVSKRKLTSLFALMERGFVFLIARTRHHRDRVRWSAGWLVGWIYLGVFV